MNVNLGPPYETAIKKIIEKGYAGNQTEVIRQAINAHERMLEEEELYLVHTAVELEMEEIKSGKIKTISLDNLEKKYKNR